MRPAECPMCRAEATERSVVVSLWDLPVMEQRRQIERNVRITVWQCLRYEEHRGEWREGTDDE